MPIIDKVCLARCFTPSEPEEICEVCYINMYEKSETFVEDVQRIVRILEQPDKLFAAARLPRPETIEELAESIVPVVLRLQPCSIETFRQDVQRIVGILEQSDIVWAFWERLNRGSDIFFPEQIGPIHLKNEELAERIVADLLARQTAVDNPEDYILDNIEKYVDCDDGVEMVKIRMKWKMLKNEVNEG